MNDKKYKEKLLEFLVELGKPKKYEVGYADGSRIISDGLRILGMDANDILGFTKAPDEIRIRKVRGSQAWFNSMYANGWRYSAKFEYEGLSHNGFYIMYRELPNLTLNAIREELEVMLRDDEGERYKHTPNPEILRGGPMLINSDVESVVPKGLAKKKITLTEKGRKVKEAVDRAMKGEDIIFDVPKAVKEPREGFESDVSDFMLDAKKEMKTEEELFFEGTGKKAVWHGKETKAFKLWKEGLNNAD